MSRPRRSGSFSFGLVRSWLPTPGQVVLIVCAQVYCFKLNANLAGLFRLFTKSDQSPSQRSHIALASSASCLRSTWKHSDARSDRKCSGVVIVSAWIYCFRLYGNFVKSVVCHVVARLIAVIMGYSFAIRSAFGCESKVGRARAILDGEQSCACSALQFFVRSSESSKQSPLSWLGWADGRGSDP